MRVNAYAKINWTLNVTGKLQNGYHTLDMLTQRISLFDTLEISQAEALSLFTNGAIDPYGEKNLVLKAARALQEETNTVCGARIDLTKRIPQRAGLGGGSSDCAATLLALNDFWHCALPMERLLQIGASLGADIPMCLLGSMARVTGFGETVQLLPFVPKAYLAMVQVGDGLSTPAVFAAFDAMESVSSIDTDKSLDALRVQDYASLQKYGGNHLEEAAICLLPDIQAALTDLRRLGAMYTRMSGSGSVVYGVFPTMEKARLAAKQLGNNAFTAETIQ